MTLAEAASADVIQLTPEQVWQGKRGAVAGIAPRLPTLSKKEQGKVKALACSVFDDDDDGWTTTAVNVQHGMYDGKSIQWAHAI